MLNVTNTFFLNVRLSVSPKAVGAEFADLEGVQSGITTA